MAALDVLKTERRRASPAPVSRERVRKAARLALSQVEDALSEGDSRRAKELTGVLRELLQLHRELQGGASQSVTVCFVGEAEEMAR